MSLGFDATTATAAYLATVSPAAHARAQAYTQGGNWLLLWGAVVGVAVALSQRDDGHWSVRFADVPLLLIDHKTQRIARYGPGRPPTPVANTNPAPKLSGV